MNFGGHKHSVYNSINIALRKEIISSCFCLKLPSNVQLDSAHHLRVLSSQHCVEGLGSEERKVMGEPLASELLWVTDITSFTLGTCQVAEWVIFQLFQMMVEVINLY